jgi:hypothetical protein
MRSPSAWTSSENQSTKVSMPLLEHLLIRPVLRWCEEDVHIHLLVVAEHTKEFLAFQPDLPVVQLGDRQPEAGPTWRA